MAYTKTEETYSYTIVIVHDEDSGEEVRRQTIQDDWLYDSTEPETLTEDERMTFGLPPLDPEGD